MEWIKFNIVWGTRMTGFAMAFLLAVAVFVFHILGHVEGATFQIVYSGLCGYGAALGIARGVEKRGNNGIQE